MTQEQFSFAPVAPPPFRGATYDPEQDGQRLEKLLHRVWRYMLDGSAHTLGEIAIACGGTETSVSARLRDFRKEWWQAEHPCRVESGRVDGGLWRYRVVLDGRA